MKEEKYAIGIKHGADVKALIDELEELYGFDKFLYYDAHRKPIHEDDIKDARYIEGYVKSMFPESALVVLEDLPSVKNVTWIT